MRNTTRPTFSSAFSSSLHLERKNFSVLQTMVEKKKWTTNGAITKADKSRYFYVPLTESANTLLVPKVEEGNYVLLYGPRAASKSTHLEEAKELLQDKYCCLSTSFQTGVRFKDEDSFWDSFGRALVGDNKHVQLPSISNARDFADALQNKSVFGGKEVVLIVDEFDKLYNAPQEVTDSMLDVLRGIKQTKQNYCLHSVVAAGTFSILELTGRSSSPFNIREAVQVPFFQEDGFTQVFDEFNNDRSKAFDNRIPVDIFGRTKGHAGFTAFCCKMLDERVRIDRSRVSFDEWVEFAMLKLPAELKNYATAQKMVDTLTRDSAREARSLLVTRFLPANRPLAINDPKEEKLSRFLAAEGALIPVSSPNVFEIPSPLVHTLLMEKVIPQDKRTPPNQPVPFRENGSLDIALLIRQALLGGGINVGQTALRLSYKYGKGKNVNGIAVPSERAYHAELYYTLRSWLPIDVNVASEANAPQILADRKRGTVPRCDIVIDVPRHRYALELMASGDEASVKEHCERLKEYKTALNAEEGWVIHFTLSTEPFLPCPGDLGEDSVKVITISHDLSWTKATMHVTGGETVQLR